MKAAEILSIGNELLRGIVQDTNSHWLAKRITARGAAVRRTTLLPDEPPVVAEEIRAALQRAPALLVTQGGLGPTADDLTREAVALGTDLPLVPNDDAEQIVARRYAELHAQGIVTDVDVHEARARMTRLPRGAIALDNHVGTAPGVLLVIGATAIVCLPGVPPELTWIWDNSLSARLDAILGPGGFAEQTVVVDLLDESKIAWLLEEVQREHPAVYVKSRASGFGADDHVRVTIAGPGASDAAARTAVEAALADLRVALTAEHIALRDV